MKLPPIVSTEKQRLQELYSFDILDTQYEEDFNEVVQLASQICSVPISLISLIDKDRQWFKAKVGLPVNETSRDVSFCAHAIAEEGLFMVEDAMDDERFFDNPLVVDDPSIRFYAGMPLVSKNGFKIGTLCVIDRTPRNLDEKQVFAMKVLSEQVIKLFELRLNKRETEERSLIIQKQKNRLEELNEVQNKIISIISHDIRSPLSSLRQILQLKEREVIDAGQAGNLMVIVNTQVDETIDMLDNLVDWSSILVSKTDVDKTRINLHEIVEDAVEKIKIAALLKDNELHNNIDKLLFVTSDSNILKFIFRNLLANSNKFTAAGTISINAEVLNPHSLKVIIRDSGTGMSTETLARLIDSSRHHSTPGTNNEKGSGLGFMLVKDFIDKIGSTISIDSMIGFGTTITFTLPVFDIT